MNNLSWQEVEKVVEDALKYQKMILLKTAKKIVPQVIADDLMQPNDFELLENNPLFRYEEGVLAGIQVMDMALKALKKEKSTLD